MTQEVDDFLAHYGVKGMKWGTRKAVGLAERSASNSEATPYRQAKVDTKARKAAVNSRGKGATNVKRMTRGVIKERMGNDPAYKAAKQKYDRDQYNIQSAKIAATTLGLISAPYLLSLAGAALDNQVVPSIHNVVYKEFEKSAYGQRRREQGKMFVDNSKHRVVDPAR